MVLSVANICDSPVKAVEKLIQEHLLPNAPEDANEFRTRFLYTEEVSDIFSEYIVVVRSPKLALVPPPND